LHLTVDLIKQGRGTRAKIPVAVFLLVPNLHLHITTFTISAADATEHKICVSERLEVVSVVHVHES